MSRGGESRCHLYRRPGTALQSIGNRADSHSLPEGLPQELQGKFLWLNLSGEVQSAINRVYVAGRGWESPGILNRRSDPMPLVLKYQVDGSLSRALTSLWRWNPGSTICWHSARWSG